MDWLARLTTSNNLPLKVESGDSFPYKANHASSYKVLLSFSCAAECPAAGVKARKHPMARIPGAVLQRFIRGLWYCLPKATMKEGRLPIQNDPDGLSLIEF